MQLDGTKFTPPDDPLDKYLGNPAFVKDIHPDDDMRASHPPAVYYWIGKTALDCITALVPDQRFSRILDFPSGFGRVLRFLRSEYPEAEIVACEIVPEAVAFCEQKFDALGVCSSAEIADVDLPGDFDLIWVGSLLTHLDEVSAKKLLKLLASRLQPDGVLVFSYAGSFVVSMTENGDTAGLSQDVAARMIGEFSRCGFAFGNYEGKISLPANYGRAFIGKEWLDETRRQIGNLSEVGTVLRGYARRQDVVAWKRDK